MAASPKFKVYVHGKYIAACKHPEDAAAIIAAYGQGQIRLDHRHVLFEQGKDEPDATDSYDAVATLALKRCHEIDRETFIKAHGPAT
ncbi:MAG: hypothetical protein ACR2P5_04700 [Gammaproteobacteria bacterium]